MTAADSTCPLRTNITPPIEALAAAASTFIEAKHYRPLYHELFLEPEWEQVAADISGWLTSPITKSGKSGFSACNAARPFLDRRKRFSVISPCTTPTTTWPDCGATLRSTTTRSGRRRRSCRCR